MNIMIMLPCWIGYAWAADRFCKKYLKITPCKEILFVGCVFLIWLAADLASGNIFMPYIFLSFLCRLSLVGIVILLFQGDWEKKVLVAVVFEVAVILMGNFCGSVLSCLSLFFLHTVGNVPEPLLDGWRGNFIMYLSVLVVILFIYELSVRLRSFFAGKMRRWYLLMAVPLITVIAVMDFVNWGAAHGILVRSGGNMGMYYDQIFSHLGIGILSALFLSAVGFYLIGMNRLYLEQRKNSRYHSQITAYKMLEGQYRQSERLRHDMKNHVIALSGLLKDKEWEKMQKYLEDMGESGSLGMGEDMTGNKVVDAVLSQKRERAEADHIRWECDVQIPGDSGIQEFDLCVLFGNLVDNAIEACGRSKGENDCFICIQGGKIKKCFLLVIKNTAKKGDNAWPARKNDSESHGIGLLNVRDIVHKYHGELEIEEEEGIFSISILIPFSQTV